jgi:hypothetical protein
MDSDVESGSDTEDDEPSSSLDPSLQSPSGIQWKMQKPSSGREHRANVFTGKGGFQIGLHPVNEKEAFLTTFGGLVDTSVLYTNKSGKRWAVGRGNCNL